MYTGILFSTFLATAFAAPVLQRQSPQTGDNDSWQPAPDTTTTCATFDKSISFMRGPQLETVLDNACAAMMPPCAYQDRVAPGTVCTATVDYPLDGPKSNIQHANVVDRDDNSISGWDIKFDVTPATQPDTSAGVFWKVEDCYGYLARMLQNPGSEGCQNGVGSGIGSVKVGGDSSLADAEFKVTIVPRAA
ncbi:hypothetical protein G6011_07923 [Alternaria panax]|uniref:Uncharacterized protein n=1 Tax=Alternaria panax TaxID=48097 RepID=A0AAD4F7U3_9PLEO|nr:hypothetical protein G6011_07923 [Alternaria panax]